MSADDRAKYHDLNLQVIKKTALTSKLTLW